MAATGRGDGFSIARRRVVYYLVGAFLVMVAYALAYRYAMAAFEGRQVGFLHAFHIVVETFTTTGYGEDAGLWTSPAMKALMIAMQLTGVTLVFLTFPLFLVPLVEEALATDPPVETDLTGHVVVCSFTPTGEVLVDELDSMGVDYVVVESDRNRAEKLHSEGYTVVHGDPESVETLERAGATDAMALVADADDETNASIVLSAREVARDLRVVSLVEDATLADYHRYAGADRVVSPRRLLGESVASKAAPSISSNLGDAVEIGEDFEIVELLVQRGSSLQGTTIAESGVAERGINVIGAWFRGVFVSPPAPDDVIDEHTILLVAGREERLERLRDLTLSKARRYRRGKVVVAGYGEVGSTASDMLVRANVPNVVVDVEDKPGVDVVGDATDQKTLDAADVPEARSVVLALDDDTTAIFATLAIKQVAPDTEVIARANDPESVSKLYRAGAEYVLARPTVSGRMVASHLLDKEVLAPESQLEIVRTRAPALTGQSLADADVRARTGCTVIAAERDGELVTDVGPEFVVRPDDELVVVGTDADINRFNEFVG